MLRDVENAPQFPLQGDDILAAIRIGPPILDDKDIDDLAVGEHGVQNIRDAMKSRGDLRKSGYTKKNLASLVVELKDCEAGRRIVQGIPPPIVIVPDQLQGIPQPVQVIP